MQLVQSEDSYSHSFASMLGLFSSRKLPDSFINHLLIERAFLKQILPNGKKQSERQLSFSDAIQHVKMRFRDCKTYASRVIAGMERCFR